MLLNFYKLQYEGSSNAEFLSLRQAKMSDDPGRDTLRSMWSRFALEEKKQILETLVESCFGGKKEEKVTPLEVVKALKACGQQIIAKILIDPYMKVPL